MRRRGFIGALGSAAVAWPHAADAQPKTLPTIGFLHPALPDGKADRVRAFREGLKDTGFVEGENVDIEYRWANNGPDRLPALATDLVHRRAAVIATFGPLAVFAAKAVTSTIPIVFLVRDDPVGLGLVKSLARPGGNLTGVNFLPAEVSGKRFALLGELVPNLSRLAVFVDANNRTSAAATLRDMDAPLRTMGLQGQVYSVGNSRDIDAVFDSFVRERPDAVFVAISASLVDQRVQFALQAMRHRLPSTFPVREFAEAGGLMSYGASLREAIRQTGVYCGRILKGAKPVDLPVARSDKLELVINQQTARMLRIAVPASFIARADEVIE
jgi:putative ABC transport system substrate-binding protein